MLLNFDITTLQHEILVHLNWILFIWTNLKWGVRFVDLKENNNTPSLKWEDSRARTGIFCEDMKKENNLETKDRKYLKIMEKIVYS